MPIEHLVTADGSVTDIPDGETYESAKVLGVQYMPEADALAFLRADPLLGMVYDKDFNLICRYKSAPTEAEQTVIDSQVIAAGENYGKTLGEVNGTTTQTRTED